MTALVPVIAIPLLRIPNMLLLARIAASLALICEWPETYVKAPRPRNVALPTTRHGVQSSNSALSFLRASLKVGAEGGGSAIIATLDRQPSN